MNGGLDADQFKFFNGNSLYSNTGFDDIIFDYNDIVDRFDLSAVSNINGLADINVVNFTDPVFGAGAYIQYSSVDRVFVVGYSQANVSLGDFIF